MSNRDGHVRVLPLHVANKIAAGEVVERPASVVKELLENAIDAGARKISVSIVQGGRKLVAVRDDGCGMTRDDAVLALERQATSKILDVDDIERIDTLGFRGEAIPSIASVSRFSLTTRRADSDEGTAVTVNAGVLAEVRAAGCPVGTLVEVRDLFCNVPARRKFLRAYATEESHVRAVFTVHALAHPNVAFTLSVDGREVHRLAASEGLADRVRDLFGGEFLENLLPLPEGQPPVAVTGYVEKPNLYAPTRREQYVFVNGRPASSPSIQYALREAYPRRQGDVRPAAVIFLTLPPGDVDVNVHPTKREVRFRNNVAVRTAVMSAIEAALRPASPGPVPSVQPGPVPSVPSVQPGLVPNVQPGPVPSVQPGPVPSFSGPVPNVSTGPIAGNCHNISISAKLGTSEPGPVPSQTGPVPRPMPVQSEIEFAVDPDSTASRPWVWFRFLATTDSGYLLIETDSGVVTVNPHAARERIAYERLSAAQSEIAVQQLLIPETVQLSPADFARIRASLATIERMGFRLEEFGPCTFKVEAVPQLTEGLSPAGILQTIARDLADGSGRRTGDRWREELVAKSVARSFAGMSLKLDERGAVKLVEELAGCRMPYVCPRGKPIMIFMSTRELDRRFAVSSRPS